MPSPKYWSKAKGMPIQKDDLLKNLKADLSGFSTKLERGMNHASKNGILINGDWLENESTGSTIKSKSSNLTYW